MLTPFFAPLLLLLQPPRLLQPPPSVAALGRACWSRRLLVAAPVGGQVFRAYLDIDDAPTGAAVGENKAAAPPAGGGPASKPALSVRPAMRGSTATSEHKLLTAVDRMSA